jgi:hypothetical protein
VSTSELIYFNLVLPAIIVAIALAGLLLHKRSLRKHDQARPPREAGMTLAERDAELESTLAALLAGASGWPAGMIDPGVKRLEAQIEALSATDEELRQLSGQYQSLASRHVGTTSAAIMIEIARRATLSGHQRVAEAAERRRTSGC